MLKGYPDEMDPVPTSGGMSCVGMNPVSTSAVERWKMSPVFTRGRCPRVRVVSAVARCVTVTVTVCVFVYQFVWLL